MGEAEERRARSRDVLQAAGVTRLNSWLPGVATEAEAVIRSLRATCERTVALALVAAAGAREDPWLGRKILAERDAADLIYLCRNAIVQARLDGDDTPGGFDADVAYERHYALNWLIGYPERDTPWDEITCDT